jgi:hypothetical protein
MPLAEGEGSWEVGVCFAWLGLGKVRAQLGCKQAGLTI